MTGFQIEVDAHAAQAAVDAHSGGNGKFPPLPGGEYQAILVPLGKDKPRVEVVDFGGQGPNGKKKVLRVAFQIVDGSPTGAKRVFFDRIPLFTRYAPTEKNPLGAPARKMFDFFNALGVTDEQILANQLPGPDFIMGKPFGIVLSAPIEPNKYNELGSNEVSFINKAGNVAKTPRRLPTAPVAPWLDVDDNLIVEYPFQSDDAKAFIAELTGAAPAAAAGAAAPQPSWQQGNNAAATAPAGGTPQPSWATAPGGGTPGTPTPSWQQPAGDGLQAAADAAVGY